MSGLARLPRRSSLLALLFLGYASTGHASFWQVRNAPYNGDVRSIAFSTSYMLAGTYGGSSWRSPDEGSSWAISHNGMPDYYVVALANGVGAEIFAGASYGVYRTTDEGANWDPRNIFPGRVRSLAVSTASGSFGYVYAATDSGVFVSTGGGDSWSAASLRNVAPIRAVVVNADGVAYVGAGSSGVYRSIDGGTSWSPTGLATGSIACLALNATGHVFAGAYGSVYRSTDQGQNWDAIAIAPADVKSILVAQDASVFAATSPSGIYRSFDNGINWSAVNDGLTNTYGMLLAMDSEGFVYCVTGARLFRSGQSTTSVEGGPAPIRPVLLQNYPNPFNPSTTIRFELSRPSQVTLRVHDVGGRRIATLVSEHLEPGRYVKQWDARSGMHQALPNGVYVCRLEVIPTVDGLARHSEKFIDRMKMLLLK